MHIKNLGLTCICIFLVQFSIAQNGKVGLVFSGGGAKGLAHIGALKALEEFNIPIDYITGTSMGGVVGGFYAAGFSPEQIDSIATSKAFLQWINGEVPAKYKSYYIEPEPTPQWLEFNLGIDSTFDASFNPKLANDLSLNFELAEQMAPVYQSESDDFDDLFVPFKAMGAEVLTQKAVLLDKGNLATSLRATMSVPFVYRPIKIDGEYIFDGGVYNNFPVEPMKAYFNPEYMIGVNVASKVYKEYPEKEAERILSSSLLFMMMDKADPTKLEKDGVYIEPDMSKFSGFAFEEARSIIDSGYAATVRSMPEIQQKIKTRVNQDVLDSARNQFNAKKNKLIFSEVELSGFTKNQENYIRKVMFNSESGDVSIEEIKSNYYKLIEEPYFSGIFPQMIFNSKSGKYKLRLTTSDESKLKVQIGGNIATNNLSGIYLGLRYDNLNNFLNNHYLGGQLGSFYKAFEYKLRINLPLKLPFYVAPYFVYNSWDYLATNSFLTKRTSQILKQEDLDYGVELGLPIYNKYKLTLAASGMNVLNSFSSREIFQSNDTLDSDRLYGLKTQLEVGYNSFNNRVFPTDGKRLSIKLKYIYATEEFTAGTVGNSEDSEQRQHGIIFNADYENYIPLSFGSLGFNLSGAIMAIGPFRNLTATQINSPVYNPTFESPTRYLSNFRAPVYVAAGLKYHFPLFKNTSFRVETHIFKPIFNWQETNDAIKWSDVQPDYYMSALGALIYKTPLGPISVSAHYYDDRNPFYIMLNIGYLMFKERPLN